MPNSRTRVGLSESACLRRVKALGEVRGHRTATSPCWTPPRWAFPPAFLVRLTLNRQTDRDFAAFEEQPCSTVPEVMECYLTTGGSDYVLRVVARDAADFERLHSKVLTKLPGVARVESSFVLRPVVKSVALPLLP